MSLSLSLDLRQHMTLTPRLQQALRLLQLSSVEFQQELRAALDTNPFLEDGQQAGGDSGNDAPPDEPVPATQDADAGAAARDAFDDAQSLDAQRMSIGAPRMHDAPDDADPVDALVAPPTLHAYLHDTLRLTPLPPRDVEAARVIIDALDDDGYLRQPLDELAAAVCDDAVFSDAELLIALRRVQSLDKPGLGARTLAECLLLQLDGLRPDLPGLAVAREIAAHHLPELARRETAILLKATGADPDTLHAACALVRRLDPRPGLQYGGPGGDYVVPDVIVRRVRDRWIVQNNPALLPRARLHRRYAEWFEQASGSRESPLGQQLQEARWLIRNAQKRFDTIRRVGECIVARQRDFFLYGEIGLKPLVLRDVAEELGLHESTISRATGNKTMATPHGTYEFRHFFPRRLDTDAGSVCSAAAAKALMRDMIAAEDARTPLSDVALAQRLAGHGIVIARRTVTKYRQAMKIPPADLRRP
ncbi:RNA polymerase sigma-54 factor [Burkholderia sp. Bp8963]|uniref:RNA polymerase factor sigma-54 n=1 Tax=Burkholderia sp. Bp8963 TaxID=2184547 RepID=UPI000F59F9B7|nr:RNA polymerase factor sigma-54 [Burkholderia sp. Bp8963]RQS76863.1 RNA polymerase sigma-54 factor [Burkholderia sp. Bp8963]